MAKVLFIFDNIPYTFSWVVGSHTVNVQNIHEPDRDIDTFSFSYDKDKTKFKDAKYHIWSWLNNNLDHKMDIDACDSFVLEDRYDLGAEK